MVTLEEGGKCMWERKEEKEIHMVMARQITRERKNMEKERERYMKRRKEEGKGKREKMEKVR